MVFWNNEEKRIEEKKREEKKERHKKNFLLRNPLATHITLARIIATSKTQIGMGLNFAVPARQTRRQEE